MHGHRTVQIETLLYRAGRSNPAATGNKEVNPGSSSGKTCHVASTRGAGSLQMGHTSSRHALWLEGFFFNTIKKKFIYTYFWLHWVFVAARGLSLVAASGGCSSLHCAGFSLRWLLLLQSTGSRHTGFSSCGLQVQ